MFEQSKWSLLSPICSFIDVTPWSATLAKQLGTKDGIAPVSELPCDDQKLRGNNCPSVNNKLKHGLLETDTMYCIISFAATFVKPPLRHLRFKQLLRLLSYIGMMSRRVCKDRLSPTSQGNSRPIGALFCCLHFRHQMKKIHRYPHLMLLLLIRELNDQSDDRSCLALFSQTHCIASFHAHDLNTPN